MQRAFLAAAIAAVALLAAACGGATAGGAEPGADTPAGADVGDGAGGETGAPALGMCAEGVTDCNDMVVEHAGEVPEGFDAEAEQAEAEALLGVAEDELGEDVRVGRRGEEQMMLTEDYALGRDTVELEAGADGVFRVVRVVVELPEGPIVFQD